MPVNFVKQAPTRTPGISAAFTPVLGLSSSNAATGTEIELMVRGTPRPARIVDLPFTPHRYFRG